MRKKSAIGLLILVVVFIGVILISCHRTEIAETVADGVERVITVHTSILTTTEILIPTETTTEKTTKQEVKTTIKETTTKETLTKDEEQGEHTRLLGIFWVTGYTAEEGFGYGSATASGVGCRPGICAMNNQQRKELGIEYGDTIYIKDLGSYQVQDCGCGYGVVDIWMNTNAQAYAITGNYEVYI